MSKQSLTALRRAVNDSSLDAVFDHHEFDNFSKYVMEFSDFVDTDDVTENSSLGWLPMLSCGLRKSTVTSEFVSKRFAYLHLTGTVKNWFRHKTFSYQPSRLTCR